VILALDVGTKRIGVAISDPAESFAMPVAMLERKNQREDFARIAELIESYAATEVVVGDPITLAGERGIAAQAMDGFVERLRAHFGGPIHRVDERLTTAAATKTLISADVGRAKRRKAVDSLAAALILESFLARRRNAAKS
jgi:putative Holliday junction resolvase